MKRKKVIIDLATIYPGKGGAGGGIWSYSSNLVMELDKMLQKEDRGIDFICLVNRSFNLPLQNIKVKVMRWNLQHAITRLLYIHFYLPLYCWRKKAILHKSYFEIPFFPLVPTIVTIHDCMPDYYKKKNYLDKSKSGKLKFLYFNSINRRAISKSKLICTPSQFIKDEIVTDYRVRPAKIIVTPLASNVTTIDYLGNNEKSSSSGIVNLYCIGAFHPHKGHLRLLDIFEELVKKYQLDVKLYLRGHIHDPVYYEEVLAKISRLHARDRIVLVNYRAKSSIIEIYQDTDWVILLSEYEGFGLPVIEAQSFGKPVICSDIKVFREVAGDSAGYVEMELNSSAAASKMYEYLSDKGKKDQIIQNGLANAAKYSWKKFAGQMMDVYKVVTDEEQAN